MKVNYRLRDAIFSRQRYWGEPFPVYYDENNMPHVLDESELPLAPRTVYMYVTLQGDRSYLVAPEKTVKNVNEAPVFEFAAQTEKAEFYELQPIIRYTNLGL